MGRTCHECCGTVRGDTSSSVFLSLQKMVLDAAAKLLADTILTLKSP